MGTKPAQVHRYLLRHLRKSNDEQGNGGEYETNDAEGSTEDQHGSHSLAMSPPIEDVVEETG